MKSKTVLAILAGAALSLAAACNDNANTNTNTNANVNVNTNRAANANATVVNENANANANSNATNWNMSREEYNKNANGYRAEAKNKGESIGEDIEDGWIHFKVRAALAAVNDLRDSTINVDVNNKVVTLRGTVPGADQKRKAEEAAKKVDGVKSVTDKLEVKADTSANANSNSHAAANANKK
jgi:hyperosmotically inducible protein